mmetsp:Transcript_9195/g.19802  ORF Transcript_9195/g.19802 Transcript_9195/m.19802 type:complete len:298 (-) Transcript_9195:3876-4769(-)
MPRKRKQSPAAYGQEVVGCSCIVVFDDNGKPAFRRGRVSEYSYEKKKRWHSIEYDPDDMKKNDDPSEWWDLAELDGKNCLFWKTSNPAGNVASGAAAAAAVKQEEGDDEPYEEKKKKPAKKRGKPRKAPTTEEIRLQGAGSPAPAPKKRGPARPKKTETTTTAAKAEPTRKRGRPPKKNSGDNSGDGAPPAKRGPGRPPKDPKPVEDKVVVKENGEGSPVTRTSPRENPEPEEEPTKSTASPEKKKEETEVKTADKDGDMESKEEEKQEEKATGDSNLSNEAEDGKTHAKKDETVAV